MGSHLTGSDSDYATTRFCEGNRGGFGVRQDDVGTTNSGGALSAACGAARCNDSSRTCPMDAWADGGETAVDRVGSSRCCGAHQCLFFRRTAARDSASIERNLYAISQRPSGCQGSGHSGVSRFFDWSFACGASADVSIRPGSAKCGSEATLRSYVFDTGEQSGGSAYSSVAEDLDNGPSSNGAIRTFHQCRA